MNCDLANELVHYLATGDVEYAVDSQRKGLLCPDKSGSLKLTTKGISFVQKWAPSYKVVH